jgi:hypothetical protein
VAQKPFWTENPMLTNTCGVKVSSDGLYEKPNYIFMGDLRSSTLIIKVSEQRFGRGCFMSNVPITIESIQQSLFYHQT